MKEGHNWEIRKDFTYKGRRCIVSKCSLSGKFEKKCENKQIRFLLEIYPYCNGYVQIFEEEKKDSYDGWDLSEEITFFDSLKTLEKIDSEFKNKGMQFIGFDTAHIYNTKETKTEEYVVRQCKKIVDELNEIDKDDI